MAVARWAVGHGSPAVGARDRSSVVEESRSRRGGDHDRIGGYYRAPRNAGRCMRLEEVCCRSLHCFRRRIGALGGGLVGRLVQAGEVCCSQGAPTRSGAGATRLSFARGEQQPGSALVSCSMRSSGVQCKPTCSGSACAGSLSGLKPLLYAMVGQRAVLSERKGKSEQAKDVSASYIVQVCGM